MILVQGKIRRPWKLREYGSLSQKHMLLLSDQLVHDQENNEQDWVV